MLKKISIFIAAIILPQIAGAIGSFFTISKIDTWYAHLIKPSFNPPDWIFAPVWTVLFFLMGLAFFLVLINKIANSKKVAYIFFFIQLILNSLWSYLFFGLENPFYAFIEIIFLWIAIVATMYFFWKIEKEAGYLLIPYLLWVSFAAFLTYTVWSLNK